MTNKNLSYPELMQEASKAGSPDKLLADAEQKGMFKAIVTGVFVSSLLIGFLSKIKK